VDWVPAYAGMTGVAIVRSMMTLRRATPDDIPFILATERLPGYDALVGRFEEGVHRANLIDDNWLYFIGLDDADTPQGFAILQNRNDGDGSEFLRRIAVTTAGAGFGKPFLSALIDWVFAHTANASFHLHVRNTNTRARHVYTSLGFTVLGPEDGDPTSVTMALTKDAWLAR
jgi:RimJ/RimL family protein N-acetyltransferase